MRRVLPSVLVTASLATATALACGDKLMLFARGAHFQQVYSSNRAVSILAYVRQNSAVPAVVSYLQPEAALKKAGHKLEAVDNPAALEEALKTGKYDVVLADVADAEGLEQLARSARSKPVIVPVAYKPTKAQQNAAQKKFHLLLKAPNNTGQYLAAIDQAMDLKAGLEKSRR